MKLRHLQFVAIVLLTLVAGVFWGTWFGLARSMNTVSPATYLETGHAIFHNLAGPMSILFPAALLSTIGVLIGLFRQRSGKPLGGAFQLSVAGFVLFVTALVITLRVNVPIDYKVQPWTVSTLPANWQDIRDRWQLYHALRTFASLGGLALILAGAMFFKEE
jgi:uncharacterized membrane protein